MAKTLTFTYKDKEYTLEYTRRTIREMEKAGFVAEDISTKPVTTLPMLFAGAFKAHHRNLNPQLIEEIFENLGDRQELITKLGEMYSEPVLSLIQGDENAEGNVTWTASF